MHDDSTGILAKGDGGVKRTNATPPTKAQQQHAAKITHRAASGQFKSAPHKQRSSQISNPNDAKLNSACVLITEEA